MSKTPDHIDHLIDRVRQLATGSREPGVWEAERDDLYEEMQRPQLFDALMRLAGRENVAGSPPTRVDDVYTVDGRMFRRLIQGLGDACVEIERHNQNSEAITRTEKLDAWRALTHDAIKVDPGRFAANAAIAEGQASASVPSEAEAMRRRLCEVLGWGPDHSGSTFAAMLHHLKGRLAFRDGTTVRDMWTLVDREDGVLVARSPAGVDVPLAYPHPGGESASFEAATANHTPMTRGHDGLLRPGMPSNVEGCPSNECQIRRQCTGTPCRMGSAMSTSAAIRALNRAAAALAGHPNPGPLLEKMTEPHPLETVLDMPKFQRVPLRATTAHDDGALRLITERRNSVALRILGLIEEATRSNTGQAARQWIDAFSALMAAPVAR